MFLASYHSRAGPEIGSSRVTSLGRHNKTLNTREYLSTRNETLEKQGGNQ